MICRRITHEKGTFFVMQRLSGKEATTKRLIEALAVVSLLGAIEQSRLQRTPIIAILFVGFKSRRDPLGTCGSAPSRPALVRRAAFSIAGTLPIRPGSRAL